MSEKLWGGRFEEDTNAIVNRFNASIRFDRRMFREDIEGSIAHATMLGRQGIIAVEDAGEIVAGLKAVESDIEANPAVLTEEAEDIHMNVETLLRAKIGPVAGKLHTARSRNDQVATDIRLWLKREIGKTESLVVGMQSRLLELAREHIDVILPGATHLQHAQPVRLSHHLLAYFWMLGRDRVRLSSVRNSADALPLGAGALAGTTFPIDREFVARQLGFDRITENSMDSVSDRDFVIEALAALSLIMVHLSRLGEELILWSAPEFGYVTMGDAVTTGSSIMPQKKNPDVAEHARGKSGRVFGSLMSLLTTMKGLPLTYAGDMQEDKEPLFDGFDTVEACLEALTLVLNDIAFNEDRMAAALRGDFSTATDLADYLVTKGLPFRDAHEVVGKIVGDCVRMRKALEDFTATDLVSYSALFADAPEDIASVEASVERRNVPGGTARAAVLEQIEMASRSLPPPRPSATPPR